MAKSKKKRHQAVILTLSDGRSVTFHGPEQVSFPDDSRLRVLDLVFTEPLDLPDDCEWGSIVGITEDYI